MESILEESRRLHEERERLIDLQVKEMLRKKQGVCFYIGYFSYLSNIHLFFCVYLE
jgi:hypothetical protein